MLYWRLVGPYNAGLDINLLMEKRYATIYLLYVCGTVYFGDFCLRPSIQDAPRPEQLLFIDQRNCI